MSFSIDGISSLVSNAQNSAAAGSASALKNSISSENDTDFAIVGDGFFAVRCADGETRYT